MGMPTAENHSGPTSTLGVDREGNLRRHVERDASGNFWLTSKLDGRRHYIRQVRDVIVDSGKLHPTTGEAIYTAMGSFAMGRDDDDPATGIVLNNWVDADRTPHGGAGAIVNQ